MNNFQQNELDIIDGVRLKGTNVDLTIDEPKEPQKLRLFHQMTPAQKIQTWLVITMTVVTIITQLVSILGQVSLYIDLHRNNTNNLKWSKGLLLIVMIVMA